jgi:hypothetical protein
MGSDCGRANAAAAPLSGCQTMEQQLAAARPTKPVGLRRQYSPASTIRHSLNLYFTQWPHDKATVEPPSVLPATENHE